VNAVLDRSGIDPRAWMMSMWARAVSGRAQGFNFGRMTSIASRLPLEVSGMTLDRKCSSGLNAVALAARAIRSDEVDVAIAAGAESISMTMGPYAPKSRVKRRSCSMAIPIPIWR
jgi:acetyl-CoA C-acetyltransferase